MRRPVTIFVGTILFLATLVGTSGAMIADGTGHQTGLGLPLIGGGGSSSGSGGGGPSIDGAQLTRVRLHLETTSDWAGLTFTDAAFAVRRVTSASPGSNVSFGPRSFSISGQSPIAVDVLAVLDVPSGAQPTVAVQKGWIGDARGVVTRVIGSENVTVKDLYTNRQSSDPTVTANVSRSDLVGPGLTINKIDSRPLVLAFYYPWFKDESFESGRWWEKPAGDTNADTFKPAEVRAMVDQAAAHGIDGFIVSRNGNQDNTDRYNMVRAAAKAHGNFSVISLFELGQGSDGPLASDPTRLASLIESAAADASDQTALLVSGRPVVFVFGISQMSTAQWSVIRSDVTSSGANPFVVADTQDDGYGMQGTYRYSPNGTDAQALSIEYLDRVRTARLRSFIGTAPQTLWAATVSPGMNDTYVRPLHRTVEPRGDNGERYDATWQAAVSSLPEWVLITSWNEWYEATHIQDGQRTGMRALDQTASWAARFGG